ncbi:MAG: hypothetical protein J1D87_01245 [Lachnospiraceae bacterium]|nr:hypothetical protein [Lachnospiraceae bacterium]
MFKKFKGLCVIYLSALLLIGCGKDEALDEYQTNMETFFNDIAEINDNMNSIDVGSEGYIEELLAYLDALDEEVAWMAELEVPDEFSAVDSLADQASENMSQAVSYYHLAYEGEEYDENMESAAGEYYDRANTIIQYIITILHGEIPEGEGVTYTEEDKIFGGGYMNKSEDEVDE